MEIDTHLDAPKVTQHLSLVFVPQHMRDIIKELKNAKTPVEILKEHKYPSVKEIASKEVLFVDTKVVAQELALLMLQRNLDFAVVTEEGMPVGLVTFRDMIGRIIAKGRNPKIVQIGKIMSTPLRVIPANSTIPEAISMMTEYNIKKLPVIEDNKIIGILREEDLLKIPLRWAKFYKF